MFEQLRRSYKRTKDANSHYSVLNNAYQLIVWGLSAAGASASLAGFVFSYITGFWAAYGLPGALAVGLVFFFAAALIGSFLALIVAIGEARAAGLSTALTRPTVAHAPLLASPERQPQISANMMVTAGIGNEAPEFRVSFAANGRNVTLYLRYSYFISGLGDADWVAPMTLTLRHVDRYIKDEIITAPIAGCVETREGKRWHFGADAELQNGFPRYMIGPNMHYRGCVLIVAEDDRTEECYFIGESSSMDVKPKILGEHMWEFSRQRSDNQIRGGEIEALFVAR